MSTDRLSKQYTDGTGKIVRFGSITPVFNEEDLMEGFLNLMDVGIRVMVFSTKTFQGYPVVPDHSEAIALSKGTLIVNTDTADQVEMRNIGLQILKNIGIDYAIIADVDEWYPKETLENIKKIVAEDGGMAYAVPMTTLFRKPDWSVPSHIEPYTDTTCVAVKTESIFKTPRFVEGNPKKLMNVGSVYHFSYCKTPEKMLEKIKNFGHAKEVIEGWYENVWLPCTLASTNLHPTNPVIWPKIVPIELPQEIAQYLPQNLW